MLPASMQHLPYALQPTSRTVQLPQLPQRLVASKLTQLILELHRRIRKRL
jgi:hypothetical protein